MGIEITRPTYEHNELHYASDVTRRRMGAASSASANTKGRLADRARPIFRQLSRLRFPSTPRFPWRGRLLTAAIASRSRPVFDRAAWHTFTLGVTTVFGSALTSSCCSKRARGTDAGASPSARVIATQSVKTTESGGPRGYDASKRSRATNAILLPVLHIFRYVVLRILTYRVPCYLIKR
jgi:hypothetical protein